MNVKNLILTIGQLLCIGVIAYSTYNAIADVAYWGHAPEISTLIFIAVGVAGVFVVRIFGKRLLQKVDLTETISTELPKQPKTSQDDEPAGEKFTFRHDEKAAKPATKLKIRRVKGVADAPKKRVKIPYGNAAIGTLAAISLFVNFVISQGILLGDGQDRSLFFFFLLQAFLDFWLIKIMREKGEHTKIE